MLKSFLKMLKSFLKTFHSCYSTIIHITYILIFKEMPSQNF